MFGRFGPEAHVSSQWNHRIIIAMRWLLHLLHQLQVLSVAASNVRQVHTLSTTSLVPERIRAECWICSQKSKDFLSRLGHDRETDQLPVKQKQWFVHNNICDRSWVVGYETLHLVIVTTFLRLSAACIVGVTQFVGQLINSSIQHSTKALPLLFESIAIKSQVVIVSHEATSSRKVVRLSNRAQLFIFGLSAIDAIYSIIADRPLSSER